MKSRLTSYDDATVGMGAILNDCQYVYNDFGQLITEYQSHAGVVNTGTSPKVQYDYADGSDNTIRPLQLIYPDGRELNSDYGVTDGIDDAASRVASLIDDGGSTHLTDYSYLGSGSFVETDYTEPETKYTLVGTAGGNDPDTGDIYRGLDRFGRIKDSYWYDYGSSSDTDRIKYGYDRVGNRTYRENTVATTAGKQFDEQYLYDQIHRLKTMDRGTLNGSHTGLTSTTFGQCWTLDETGNWRGFREAPTGGSWDLVQSRTANPVNEITDITESVGPSWFAPGYNREGNMATMPQPLALTSSYTATYDAWNRLVKIAAGADIVSEYAYDGAKRRIIQKSYTDGVLSETRHLYYTEPAQWQVIEERLGTSPNSADPERQFVWGLRYIDDCILRDRDTNSNGTLDERLYALQDANWNVTGLIDSTGAIQERMAYTAYGVPLFLTNAFVPISDGYQWDNLYCGYRYEAATGLFHVRHRVLHPELGNWVQRDPIGYVDGMSLNASYANLNETDYLGLNILDFLIDQTSWLWVGTQQSFNKCFPGVPNPSLTLCFGITFKFDVRYCCETGKTCVTFEISGTGGLYLNGTIGGTPSKPKSGPLPPVGNWLKPIGWDKNHKFGRALKVPLRHGAHWGCPKEGIQGQFCGTASVGFWGYTVGARSCIQFPSGNVYTEAGMNVGLGTGFAFELGVTGTTCL